MTSNPDQDRRKHPRAKLRVEVELRMEDSATSSRGATSDLSMGGFYIETMFTMPVGTRLEITLYLENPVLVVGVVATCDPLVGNGITFTKILPEDQEELRAYIEAQEHKEAKLEAPNGPQMSKPDSC